MIWKLMHRLFGCEYCLVENSLGDIWVKRMRLTPMGELYVQVYGRVCLIKDKRYHYKPLTFESFDTLWQSEEEELTAEEKFVEIMVKENGSGFTDKILPPEDT